MWQGWILSSAVLFHSKKVVKNTSDAMMRYCENKTIGCCKVRFRDIADDEAVSFPCFQKVFICIYTLLRIHVLKMCLKSVYV